MILCRMSFTATAIYYILSSQYVTRYYTYISFNPCTACEQILFYFIPEELRLREVKWVPQDQSQVWDSDLSLKAMLFFTLWCLRSVSPTTCGIFYIFMALYSSDNFKWPWWIGQTGTRLYNLGAERVCIQEVELSRDPFHYIGIYTRMILLRRDFVCLLRTRKKRMKFFRWLKS